MSRTQDRNSTVTDSSVHTDKASVENLLARCSPANQAMLRKVLERRLNRGGKWSTQSNWARAAWMADEYANGRALTDLTPDDWVGFCTDLRKRVKASTASVYTALVKATLSAAHDDGEAPKAIRKALTIPAGDDMPRGHVISDDEWNRLLRSAANLDRHGWHDQLRLMFVTMLHVLRDAGFRASEMLALRVRSVEINEDGSAYLRLPRDAPGLKTGPRDVAVARCVAPLKAWLSMHPDPRPGAALFPGPRSKTAYKAANYQWLLDAIQATAENAEVDGFQGDALRPHDFRHTRCTEAAKSNWHPTKMDAYFGWAPGSKMSARYTHLARSDLRDQVLRDAGLLDIAQPIAQKKENPAKALLDLLVKAAQD